MVIIGHYSSKIAFGANNNAKGDFFARKGILVKEEKEGKLRRKRRKHFHRKKKGKKKGAIVTWLDIKGTTRTGKNAGSACIAIYADILVIAHILTLWNRKVRCFHVLQKRV